MTARTRRRRMSRAPSVPTSPTAGRSHPKRSFAVRADGPQRVALSPRLSAVSMPGIDVRAPDRTDAGGEGRRGRPGAWRPCALQPRPAPRPPARRALEEATRPRPCRGRGGLRRDREARRAPAPARRSGSSRRCSRPSTSSPHLARALREVVDPFLHSTRDGLAQPHVGMVFQRSVDRPVNLADSEQDSPRGTSRRGLGRHGGHELGAPRQSRANPHRGRAGGGT